MYILVTTTFIQVGKLMLCFALGFFLMRRRIVPENAPAVLSALLVNVFCPSLSFGTMFAYMTRESICTNAVLMLAASGMLIASILIVMPLRRCLFRGDSELRATMTYNLAFSNYGYVGVPLIQAVFDSATLSRFMLFTLPATILGYTYGRMMLQEEKHISFKLLFSPLACVTYIGPIVGLLEIPIPGMVTDFFSVLGACTGPVGMLLAGMVLSHCRIRDCFTDWLFYTTAGIRLLGMPLLIGGAMYLLGIRGEMLAFCGYFLCLPFGLNSIIFRQSVGKCVDKTMTSSLLCYLFSLITVPLMFTIFNLLMNCP
jgi:predicted permease